jgi:hypothetical protein
MSEGGTTAVECSEIEGRGRDEGGGAVQGNEADGGGEKESTIERGGVFVTRVLFL